MGAYAGWFGFSFLLFVGRYLSNQVALSGKRYGVEGSLIRVA